MSGGDNETGNIVMKQDAIDYGKLVDEAMHVIVYKVMKLIEQRGLPGNHHFFISFITQRGGVKISDTLVKRYPKEMTIVLQYQFQDLKVDNKGFGITLSFNGNKENIYIPFAAITTFADPSVQFGLQFRDAGYDDISIEEEYFGKDVLSTMENNNVKPLSQKEGKQKSTKNKKAENNIVNLADFRAGKK